MTKSINPNPSVREGGARPYVTSYVDRPRFHVGDLVYVVSPNGNLEGPFTVASVPAPDACTLCDEGGNPARGGSEIKMGCLAAA